MSPEHRQQIENLVVEGQSFGPYRILSLLGAGGMGAVYKARDSRLDRIVAIKILLQNDDHPHVRERFRREAQAIANLHHPNICVLHDIGHQDGHDYLVMEYLEGETLAHRLERGALRAEDVLKFAIEISDGLDKVHRQGVIHRDLKPSNIMLTKSGLKLLDFGLAKSAPAPGAALSTMTDIDITAEGTILGTLQYMAPEQLQGTEADARSDIFSLGAIVYEMLTGHKAFDGKSAANVIAAILEREPEPIQTFQDRKLRGLEYVIRRCIAKNPEDRWQNAYDLLLQLRWIAQEDAHSTSQPARSMTSIKVLTLIGALATILIIIFLLLLPKQAPAPAALIRFPVYPPQKRNLLSPGKVSPDGRTVAFVADDENGNKLIWLRSLESQDARPLAGTEDPLRLFFWSPDSKYIGFSAHNHLKKIPVLGGPVQTLGEVRGLDSGAWGGGTWSPDGTIVFASGADQPLFQIPAAGGPPSQLTTLEENQGEVAHLWPYFLPDGKHFLYLARNRNPDKTGIYVGRLGSNDRRRILDGNTLASYAPPGYLLFVRGKTLFAQPFNAERLELSGDPVMLASGLDALGFYSVSENGVLTINPSPWYPTKTQLIWFDRKGQQIALLGAPDRFFTPAVSPDEGHIAVERHIDALGYIFLSEAQRERFLRFTLEGPHDETPVWSPDGRFVAFTTQSTSRGWLVRRKRTDGQSETEDLAMAAGESYTNDWSPNGEFIAYESFDSETGWDCWLLPLTDDRKPRALLRTSFDERQLRFSADGRWIAYTSNQSGRNEVYVQTFPISGATRRISSNGGAQPIWRRDGLELFYVAPDQKLMTVSIKTSPAFEASSPMELFQLRLDMSQGLDGIRNHYDVAANGERFLVNSLVEETPSAPITVMLNWTAALKQQ